MKATIHQPEYLPWLGFFDRIKKADVFVLLDTVGYQKNGFINRNRIKTKDGAKWLTVPVQGRSPNKKINEIKIDNSKPWQKTLLSLIKENYKQAPYFEKHFPFFEETFSKKWEKVADLDEHLLRSTMDFFGISVRVVKSSNVKTEGVKSDLLISILKQLRASTYISGIGAKDYMDLELFKKNNIEVVFNEFVHPVYPQQFGDFLPQMSVIDFLFNCGTNLP